MSIHTPCPISVIYRKRHQYTHTLWNISDQTTHHNSNHGDKVYIHTQSHQYTHTLSHQYTHTMSHHISNQTTQHNDNLTAIIGTRYTNTLSHQQSDNTLQRQSNSNHWDEVYKHSVPSAVRQHITTTIKQQSWGQGYALTLSHHSAVWQHITTTIKQQSLRQGIHTLCPISMHITRQSDNTSQRQSNSNHGDKVYKHSVPSAVRQHITTTIKQQSLRQGIQTLCHISIHITRQSDNTSQRQSNSNRGKIRWTHNLSHQYTHTLSHQCYISKKTSLYTHTLKHQRSDNSSQQQSRRQGIHTHSVPSHQQSDNTTQWQSNSNHGDIRYTHVASDLCHSTKLIGGQQSREWSCDNVHTASAS
jgi:hypothetical protein